MLLNVRSAYSLLNSTIRIESYVQLAKEYGYTAIGLADEGVLHGAVEFYNACHKYGLKPLIGMVVHLPGIHDTAQRFPMVLYAKSYKGYQQLMHLSRIINSERYSLMDSWHYLKQESLELIALTESRHSELEQCLIHDDYENAVHILSQWQSIFGQENVYIGMAIYPYNALESERLLRFATTYKVPMAVNQFVNILRQEESFSLKILQSTAQNDTIDLALRDMRSVHYLYSYEQLINMYDKMKLSQCIHGTHQLIKQLNVHIPQYQTLLPKYVTPNGQTATEYLKALVNKRIGELNVTDVTLYQERANYELSIIERMGFSDYFLIVWDIMDFCHQKNIRTGPGRGSAAGSLVSYLLKITLVDPIQYDLLFERFLNPERTSMPDIDIDIPDNRRELVLQYIEKKYGHEQVAQIATFGTFGAKQAIRDTLRAVGASTEVLKQWARTIPTELDMTLDKAYYQSQHLRQLVAQSEENRAIFQVAQTLEGLPRHVSTHAAAVVIHDSPLQDIIPVMDRGEQRLMTQLTMYDVERIGLLKMDFLGLRNLSLLEEIVQLVKQQFPNFDIASIEMNDRATLNLFKQANTLGIFQFESEGIRHVLRKVQPESFEDIVAVNALFRPGPMKQIDTFVARKHKQQAIDYFDVKLQPILEKTYGIMVYQEQVMQVCQLMAGFSLGQADLLRRAMSKKQADIMEKEQQHFVQGAIQRGFSEALAKQVYDHIQEFASYGFNRSHAVVYSTLAYQLAYLKVHFPLQFYQGLLNQSPTSDYIQETKRVLKRILPLDINESVATFKVSNQALLMGFGSVKGMRHEWIDFILNDRQLAGNYTSLTQFLQRMPKKFLKQESVEALIIAGAFDKLGYNRATLVHNLPTLLKSIEFTGNNLSLFASIEPKIDWQEEWDLMTLLAKEKEVLGFTLSGHPLDKFNDLFATSNVVPIDALKSCRIHQKIQTLGIIQRIKLIQTKKQEPMAFVTLSSQTSDVSVVLFPQVYRQYYSLIKEGAIVHLYGKVDQDKRGAMQIIADKLENVAVPLARSNTSKCFIKVQDFQRASQYLPQLKQLATQFSGDIPIILVDHQRHTKQLNESYNISNTPYLKEILVNLFGIEHVVFQENKGKHH